MYYNFTVLFLSGHPKARNIKYLTLLHNKCAQIFIVGAVLLSVGLHVGSSLQLCLCTKSSQSLLSLLPSSDPLLYGGADLPHRLLYQRGGWPAVQAAQQHGGRLLVCAVCPLHLLHHSGTAVCRQSLPPWLRS